MTRAQSRALIAAAVAAGLSGQVLGQGALEEIVVTAERRATALQRTPISIAAFTAESMQVSRLLKNPH